MAEAATFTEPFRAYNFKLVINGVTEGHFTQCSDVVVRVQTIKYREAGQNQIVHSLGGPVEYSDVVLSYGLTTSREMWDWLMKSVAGTVERRNVSIIMLDSGGVQESMRWNLIDAWPCECSLTPLDTMARTVAIETLRLTFNRLERE